MPQSVSLFNHPLWALQQPRIQPFTPLVNSPKSLSTHILRLDEVHPQISGNKIFKLWYFLEEALLSSHKKIVTFGGPWSNHLAATAYCCKVAGIKLIGIVRGEKPRNLSPTLAFCIENGMEPVFISRNEYQAISSHPSPSLLEQQYGPHTLIPEGGYSPTGARGAALIGGFIPSHFTHVFTALGTATTFAGLALTCTNSRLTGIPVLKNLTDIHERLQYLGVENAARLQVLPDYHFGGYAKKTPALIDFINRFYEVNQIPLDFVYTGKMMFALHSLIEQNYFPEGSRILAIHTGGLQGNASIKDRLVFPGGQ